jgi:CRP-like cAMP-binding protein
MIQAGNDVALTRINPRADSSRIVFEQLAGGPLPRWAEFSAHVQSRRVEAGGAIFMQGIPHRFVYVVRSGLLKNVYTREDGEAWIKSFSCEGRFFASIAALQPGGLTSFSAVALEDCALERIPFEILEQFAETDLLWANTLRRAVMLFASRKEARERELLVLDAEDRYRQFAEENPDLGRRITQKDLAAYLGVTPVGLNRIIRRVRGAGG